MTMVKIEPHAPIASQLARLVARTSFDKFSAETLHWAKVSILDTLGVTLAGSAEPGVAILRKTFAPVTGASFFFGTEETYSPLDAVLINGMSAHVLDFDASNPVFAGHATMHLLAATLGAAEMADASGAAFLTAYIAGFEAQSRLARGLQSEHSDKGWFPSSTLGPMGVAASTGLLLGLDETHLAQAFSIATSFSSGLLANSGTLAKPLAAGHGARSGLLAAMLAKEEFTGSPQAFEHKFGFLNLFDVGRQFHERNSLSNWGSPYDIVVTAIGLKQYPCCGAIHASIDLLAGIIAKNRITTEDISGVRSQMITDRLEHVDRPDPVSEIDAKFSAQYCLARTVLDGRPKLLHFRDGAHDDPDVRKLMPRISIARHPSSETAISRTQQGGAEVQVTLRDGRVFRGFMDEPYGRSPGAPLPEPLLFGKFEDCAEQIMPSNDARILREAIWTLEHQPSIRSLLGMIATAMAKVEEQIL